MFLFQKIRTRNRFTSDFFKQFDFAIDKIKIEIFFYGNVLEMKAKIVWYYGVYTYSVASYYFVSLMVL